MAGPARVGAACVLCAAVLMLALPSPPVLAPASLSEASPAPGATPEASPVPVLRLHVGSLPVPEAAAPTHTVARGDTLWGIARQAGTTVAALAAANGLDPDAVLRPGRELILPPPGAAGARQDALSRAAGPARGAGGPGSREPRAAPREPRAAGGAQNRWAARRFAEAPPRPARPADRRLHLLWPSSGTITSRFGWRIHPIFGTREFHTGLDIATRWGSPVLAARSGVVRFVGWMAGYGRLIVLDHGGGLQTLYSHLSAVLVGRGQHVAQGQAIGRIGSTGWSTGPHLLFEVRRNGVPVDPARYLQ